MSQNTAHFTYMKREEHKCKEAEVLIACITDNEGGEKRGLNTVIPVSGVMEREMTRFTPNCPFLPHLVFGFV